MVFQFRDTDRVKGQLFCLNLPQNDHSSQCLNFEVKAKFVKGPLQQVKILWSKIAIFKFSQFQNEVRLCTFQ